MDDDWEWKHERSRAPRVVSSLRRGSSQGNTFCFTVETNEIGRPVLYVIEGKPFKTGTVRRVCAVTGDEGWGGGAVNCNFLMRKETRKRLGARDFNAFAAARVRVAAHSSRDFASTDACPAQSFSTSLAGAYPHAPNRAACLARIFLSTRTRPVIFFPLSLSLFLFLSISIRTYTHQQQRTRAHRERSDAHAHKERQRGRAALADPARNFYHRRSYHRRIHECCREFCIMHGPRSAELPA